MSPLHRPHSSNSRGDVGTNLYAAPTPRDQPSRDEAYLEEQRPSKSACEGAFGRWLHLARQCFLLVISAAHHGLVRRLAASGDWRILPASKECLIVLAKSDVLRASQVVQDIMQVTSLKDVLVPTGLSCHHLRRILLVKWVSLYFGAAPG